MGATSRIVAAVMIGLTVTGCGLTRQAEREAAQRAADDTRCRSYGFRIDGYSINSSAIRCAGSISPSCLAVFALMTI
jgi:hypothetical protein